MDEKKEEQMLRDIKTLRTQIESVATEISRINSRLGRLVGITGIREGREAK